MTPEQAYELLTMLSVAEAVGEGEANGFRGATHRGRCALLDAYRKQIGEHIPQGWRPQTPRTVAS